VSLLEYSAPAPPRPRPLRQSELEDAFRAWAEGTELPETVTLDDGVEIPLLELSRLLLRSPTPLPPSASTRIGLGPDESVASAATALLRSTVDPAGPRCRSFRSAVYFLRGLSRLEEHS